MIYSEIVAIEYILPEKVETNQDIAKQFPDWTIEKIELKTGIVKRHIAGPTETAGDLAFQAAEKLFMSRAVKRDKIDYLLLCTECPDYILPPTACILQSKLGLSNSIGAFDFNLGCSGYIYGLSLAKALIESGQANNLLLLTADTYSKYLHPEDKGVRTIFGDGATATYIRRTSTPGFTLSFPCFGTDGSGFENLIIRQGASRYPVRDLKTRDSNQCLHMNGPEIFNFTIKTLPDVINRALQSAEKNLGDIDYFIFHQANQYMLEHIRDKIGIPQEKFCIDLRDYGNTVSSTIPIALCNALYSGRIKSTDTILLVGFGVGYSWGSIFISSDKNKV